MTAIARRRPGPADLEKALSTVRRMCPVAWAAPDFDRTVTTQFNDHQISA